MSGEHEASEQTLNQARKVLEQRFLSQAENDEAEAQVESRLGDKIEGLRGQSQTMRNLRALSAQASELWRNRGSLSRKQLLYLTAGLLYFISPIDAVTDVIPLLGYIDDVAVLGWILTQIMPAADKLKQQAVAAKDATIEQATDRLVDKGRVALNEVVDERSEELLQRLDEAADEAIGKYVSAVVIGLWGTTTAAALSLAVSILSGGYSSSWLIYVASTTVLVLGWNLAVAIMFWRRYRQLDQSWRERLPRIIGTRVARWRHLLAVSLPLLAFAALAAGHLWLHR